MLETNEKELRKAISMIDIKTADLTKIEETIIKQKEK
jgi:hypothetical protein